MYAEESSPQAKLCIKNYNEVGGVITARKKSLQINNQGALLKEGSLTKQ